MTWAEDTTLNGMNPDSTVVPLSLITEDNPVSVCHILSDHPSGVLLLMKSGIVIVFPHNVHMGG